MKKYEVTVKVVSTGYLTETVEAKHRGQAEAMVMSAAMGGEIPVARGHKITLLPSRTKESPDE